MDKVLALILDLKEKNISIQEENGQIKLRGNISSLSNDDKEIIKGLKDSLLLFFSSTIKNDKLSDRIEVLEQQQNYKLSSAQQRLWVLSQFEEGSIAYNMQGVFELEGKLNNTALEYAFAQLIERHESLRTVFKEDHFGEVKQFIVPYEESTFKIQTVDLREDLQKDLDLKSLIKASFDQKFDLSAGTLLRVNLFQIEDSKWIFSYVMHHIISDGWSMGVLVKEIVEYYNNSLKGVSLNLPPLRIQYKDFADWQQRQVSSNQLNKSKQYWLKQFEGDLPILEFPLDKSRPALKTYNGGKQSFVIDAVLTKEIRRFSSEQGNTLFMGLYALINILLNKYTGQSDFIIGTPTAGRQQIDLEQQIGLYINTLALKNHIDQEDSFSKLIEKVKETTVAAFEHENYPFDVLIDDLKLKRDMSRSALFDVMLILQNTENTSIENIQLNGLTIKKSKELESTVSLFDLNFEFTETNDTIELDIEFNSDLFYKETIDRLGKNLLHLLTEVIQHPNRAISEISCIHPQEKEKLLHDFNNTFKEVDETATLVDLFEKQVVLHADKVALVFENSELSYQELNEQINRFSNYLRSHLNICQGDLVGIKLNRSEWMIIAVLSVLKSGAAYVPVDLDYPDERINYMLSDSNCKAVIDQNIIEEYKKQQNKYSDENLNKIIQNNDLAYVIYTSGSTGQPKGVLIEHRSIVNSYTGWKSAYNLEYFEVSLLQLASMSFDVFMGDICRSLLTGGKMIICSNDIKLNPENLYSLIQLHKISILEGTPGLLLPLFDYLESSKYSIDFVKVIIFGSDILNNHAYTKLQRKLGESIRIINSYGTTETTIDSSYYESISENTFVTNVTPIGKPFCNTQIFILNDHQQLVPIGAIGEICIAGKGLARGYLNQPTLTSEKFISNPFQQGGKIYRTGDLGKYLPDGNIEFLGRTDTQIKIRGYRIEAGEIEYILQLHSAIEKAVVLATGEKEDSYLTAFLATKKAINNSEIRIFLASKLPVHMIPTNYVKVDAFPLTPNGKIDRKALLQSDTSFITSDKEYLAPRNEVESKLAEIWKTILNIEKISVHDNFFELGGHSLKAVTLSGKIHKEFNVKLKLQELFSNVLLSEQSLLISTHKKSQYAEIEICEKQDHYLLSNSQKRVWILSQFEEGNIAYNMPGVFEFEGDLNFVALESAFNQLISRHEILRTIFKEDEVGEIKQFILSPTQSLFTISQVDLRLELLRNKRLSSDLNEAFDLSKGPLMRVNIYQIEDSKWIFSFVMHHIISDGWSMKILVKEVVGYYNNYIKGEKLISNQLRIHYKDYANWQLNELSSSRLQKSKEFWIKQLEGNLPILEFPVDKSRPSIKTYNGNKVSFEFDKKLTQELHQFSLNQGVTLFMSLYALINTLLYKYTGQKDLIIGTPIAGRKHSDLEEQIGFYINTLALRFQLAENDNFTSIVNKVKLKVVEAFEHEEYHFDVLVDDLQLTRDMSRSPLFDVMINLQNKENAILDNLQLGEITLREFKELEGTVSLFDLSFDFTETQNTILCDIEYNTDLFYKETINRLKDNLIQVLEDVMMCPKKPISEISFLSEQEENLLLHAFNDTFKELPNAKTFIDLFEEQVLVHPHSTALVFKTISYTYSELNSISNQFAHYLLSHYSVKPDDLVGIQLERSEWVLISILAIYKAGAAYIPIDPEYPAERIEFIRKNAKCKLVLDQNEVIAFQKSQASYPLDNPAKVNSGTDLAYVIYTSGSTGQPKGSMIEHAGMLNHLFAMADELQLNENSKIAQIAGYTFDISVWQLLNSLIVGGATVIYDYETILEPTTFIDQLNKDQISILQVVPSYLKSLLEVAETEHRADFSNLNYLLVTGEAVNQPLLKWWFRIFPNIKVVNAYGPAEASDDVTLHIMNQAPEGSNVPVGKPIQNNKIYILNAMQQLCPIGVEGEICVSGIGVGRGYLNDPERTKMSFVSDPFEENAVRMYRTGDIGRWRSDGTIEFTGRKDDQVKIRGYRIELGEIESSLLQYPPISEAVIVAREDQNKEKNLVAYFVSETTLNREEIREYLLSRLPMYMVPTFFVQLESMPLNANGKVDKKALPIPDETEIYRSEIYVEARNETEAKVAEIWKEVLQIETIGMKDDFFELGGHSLKAIMVLGKIQKEFNVKIKIENLFENPTIEYLAFQTNFVLQQNAIKLKKENLKEIEL